MAHLNSDHNPHQLHHTTTPTIAATTASNKFADIHSILSKTFASRSGGGGGGGGGLDQTSLDKPQQQQNSEFSPLLPESLMDSLNDNYTSSNGSIDTKSLLGRQSISRSLKKPKLSEKITIDKANINKSKKRSINTGLMKAIKDKKFIKVEELFASKFKIWKDVAAAEAKEQDSVLDYKRYRSYEKNLPFSEPIKPHHAPHHFENQDEEDQDQDQDQEVHRFEGNDEETPKSIQAMTNTTLNDLHYQRERGPEMSYFDHQELSPTMRMHDNDFRPDRHLFADGDDNENNRDDDVEQDFRFNESNIIREMERLKKKLSEEQLFQKQVSMLLREFYHNCLNDSEKIAKYCNELVHAHKCLLVSGEKQKLIQQEMQNLVDSQNILQYRMLVGSPKQSVKGDKGGETVEKDCFRRGCLAIRSVTLKLRNTQYCQNYFQNKTECFVLCLMEHKSSLMETPVLCINEAQHSQRDSSRTIVIDINEIFFELNQEFELILKFYFMFHPYVKDNDNNWKQMLHKRLLGWLKKLFGRKATINGRTGDRLVRKRRHPLDISEIKVVSFHKKYSQDPPPLSSNFSLIGHIKLNIDNVNKQLMKLEHFNYCTIFEDEVRLDSEISYDYKFFN